MKYNFKSILDKSVYDNTRVMFIAGKYDIFNNLVADSLKDTCITESGAELLKEIRLDESEFDIESNNNEDISSITSVDLPTFFSVINVANLYGKWFCRVNLKSLTAKQKDTVMAYAKNPSINGILVIVSSDFMEYRDYINRRVFTYGRFSHIIELSFPARNILKSICAMMFEDKGMKLESSALDTFMTVMSREYGEYENVANTVLERFNTYTNNGEHIEKNKDGLYKIDQSMISEYLKGIEYFNIDDFIYETVKPLKNGNANDKKVFRMMFNLIDTYDGADKFVSELAKHIDELIDFRLFINLGYIPVSISYLFTDAKKEIDAYYRQLDLEGDSKAENDTEEGDKEYRSKRKTLLFKKRKFAKMSESQFRRKASIASRMSLRDWEFTYIILSQASNYGFPNSNERERKCREALYFVVSRSVMPLDHLLNAMNVQRINGRDLKDLDKITYSIGG